MQSNSPEVVEKNRFFQIGKKAPDGSSFKGKVTAESIFGGDKCYFNYSGRENSDDEQKENNGSLFDYTSRYVNKKNVTMTNFGYLDSDEKRNKFRQLGLEQLADEGRLVWETVISLESSDIADKYGMFSQEDF